MRRVFIGKAGIGAAGGRIPVKIDAQAIGRALPDLSRGLSWEAFASKILIGTAMYSLVEYRESRDLAIAV